VQAALGGRGRLTIITIIAVLVGRSLAAVQKIDVNLRPRTLQAYDLHRGWSLRKTGDRSA